MIPKDILQTVLTATASIALTPNITHLFGPHLSDKAAVYLASEPDYRSHVTQRWTEHGAPSYIATIRPANVEDVQTIVRIAAENDIPFLATGGGHGVSLQMADLRSGLQVDLAEFTHVDVNAEDGLLTIGGGTKFSHLIDPLDREGRQFPLGTAPCVAVMGATLGAGVSASQGYTGLLIDLLQEVTIVTADGNLRNVSRTQHPDLFWALRGAGANFGIVTSATFKIPPTVNGGNITNANYLFSGDMARAVYDFLASFDDAMPAELALNIGSLVIPGTTQLALVLNANFAGSSDSALQYLEHLVALQPLRSEILNVRWRDVFSTSYFGVPDTKACGRNQHVNMRTVGANSTDPAALVDFLYNMDRFSKAIPGVRTAMMIHRFPTDKVLEVPDQETAYPHRALKMHIQMESEIDEIDNEDVVDTFLDEARDKLMAVNGFGRPAAYVNFATGREGVETLYGERNIRKLTEVKKQWDARSLFSYYNRIPLAP